MKTFIVYDLDSQIPVAVGEQVSAETARYCPSAATGISTQIFWPRKLIWNYLVNNNAGNVYEGIPANENELCSSVCAHFHCVLVASIRSFTTSCSSQTRAAIQRRTH